jgi:DNA-binding NarL/FixJ family response regulator
MRGGGVLPDSLDQPINSSEDGDTLTRGDLLAAPPDRDADLAMDLYRAREKLTERQRLVIDGLADQVPVTEIARRIGVSRDTVHEEVKRIRALFTDQGLRDHLG